MNRHPHVIVVGAGWAGLTAAAELVTAGIRVTLLEMAPNLGGRARGIDFGEQRVDNGQHLLIGAYHEVIRQLKRVGLEAAAGFEHRPMQLVLKRRETELVLSVPRWLPAPLHLLWALGMARGLGLRHRLAALRFALSMGLRRFRLTRDLPLTEFLSRHGQPEAVVERLWSPLCLATLNTPCREASSQLFLTVLRDSFSRRRADADLLLPQADLGSVFPEPMAAYIRAQGGEIRSGARVTELLVEDSGVAGVRVGDETIHGEAVIVATAPGGARRLLSPFPSLSTLTAQLEALQSSPITTVYLRYPHEVRLDPPLQGLLGTHSQWVMSRASCAQPDLLSVVISGPGPHMDLERQQLAEAVAGELSVHFPQLAEPRESLVIREKHATFLATPESQSLRPGNQTPIDGLWLAGDYTHGPYPATLEGAVRSGVQCARLLLAQASIQ